MLEIALLCLFAAAAWYDYKERRIPDVITSSGWFLLCLNLYTPGIIPVAILAIAGAMFGLLYFINSIVYAFGFSPPLFGWGDILLLPLYGAYCMALTSETNLFTLLPFMLLGVFYFIALARGKGSKEKVIPLAPFVFGAALIVFVVQIAL